jgi:hypothetical protein
VGDFGGVDRSTGEFWIFVKAINPAISRRVIPNINFLLFFNFCRLFSRSLFMVAGDCFGLVDGGDFYLNR